MMIWIWLIFLLCPGFYGVESFESETVPDDFAYTPSSSPAPSISDSSGSGEFVFGGDTFEGGESSTNADGSINLSFPEVTLTFEESTLKQKIVLSVVRDISITVKVPTALATELPLELNLNPGFKTDVMVLGPVLPLTLVGSGTVTVNVSPGQGLRTQPICVTSGLMSFRSNAVGLTVGRLNFTGRNGIFDFAYRPLSRAELLDDVVDVSVKFDVLVVDANSDGTVSAKSEITVLELRENATLTFDNDPIFGNAVINITYFRGVGNLKAPLSGSVSFASLPRSIQLTSGTGEGSGSDILLVQGGDGFQCLQWKGTNFTADEGYSLVCEDNKLLARVAPAENVQPQVPSGDGNEEGKKWSPSLIAAVCSTVLSGVINIIMAVILIKKLTQKEQSFSTTAPFPPDDAPPRVPQVHDRQTDVGQDECSSPPAAGGRKESLQKPLSATSSSDESSEYSENAFYNIGPDLGSFKRSSKR